MKKTIHLGIVDDDLLIVDLLKTYFEQQEGLEVVLTAAGGKEAMAQLPSMENLPSVLLLDLRMAEMDGMEVAKELNMHFPDIHVVVLSSYYKAQSLSYMLKLNVAAFLPKGISPEQLVDVIREVDKKGYCFLEDQIDVLREQLSPKSPKPIVESQNALSEREIEILKLLAEQKTAKEIADRLFITQRTVEGHKNNLFAKTGAKNLAGLIVYAVQNDIIDVRSLPQF